jgi:hypothetical protein
MVGKVVATFVPAVVDGVYPSPRNKVPMMLTFMACLILTATPTSWARLAAEHRGFVVENTVQQQIEHSCD